MKPIVSVILTHQLDENLPYLKLALRGLASTKGIPYEVWLMNGSESLVDERETSLDHFHVIWDKSLNTATKKIEKAIKEHVSPESTHILLLSDDVIICHDTILNLYLAFRGREMIMNPMSNSDLGSLYEADLKLSTGKILKPDMSIEDLNEKEVKEIIETEKPSGHLLIPVPQLSFYCTMLSKTVITKVGWLDPKLEYRANDVDYCWRALQQGIHPYINLSAFAFHFGTKTLRKIDKDSSLANQGFQYFKKKWNL